MKRTNVITITLRLYLMDADIINKLESIESRKKCDFIKSAMLKQISQLKNYNELPQAAIPKGTKAIKKYNFRLYEETDSDLIQFVTDTNKTRKNWINSFVRYSLEKEINEKAK